MATEGEETATTTAAAEKTFLVQSEDGMELLVSESEASQSMTIDGETVCYDGEPIYVNVDGETLSKVLHYCKKHAAAGDHDDLLSAWDAELVRGVDLETLYDLILVIDRLLLPPIDRNHQLRTNRLIDDVQASKQLEVRGLLDLACGAVAGRIKGRSPREICHLLDIRGVFFPDFHQQLSSARSGSRSSESTARELKLTEKALRALHVVRVHEFTSYEPKQDYHVCYRFHHEFNTALFDYHKETRFCRAPPLCKRRPARESLVGACLNIISLKVRESDVGFPINVFGTVVARDSVDYRCVYLFRRDRDDPQLITSPDDVLSLSDPCRALVPRSRVHFEIDLKIKCDGGADQVFSKGLEEFDSVRLATGKETMTLGLESYLSRLELSCVQVYTPVEATFAINVLKGPCNISRAVVATRGNFRDRRILYEATDNHIVIGDGGSVPLTRRVVAVPRDQKLALFLVGGDDVVLGHLALTLGHSDEVVNRKMGCAELEVKVAWTAVPRRKRPNMFKEVGDVRLLL
uniref:SKP1-like protein 4 n=1 Tax=Aegilops tauschii TaxID=37682 RepID=M8BQZ8_AEGTA